MIYERILYKLNTKDNKLFLRKSINKVIGLVVEL
jgi:hypothetical protein